MIKKWRKKRAGKWVPEDRLRAALIGAIWFIPPAVALFGIANAYIDGTPGLVVCLFCLFINGMGTNRVVVPVLMPCHALTFSAFQWSQKYDGGHGLRLCRPSHRTMGSSGDELGCNVCFDSWGLARVDSSPSRFALQQLIVILIPSAPRLHPSLTLLRPRRRFGLPGYLSGMQPHADDIKINCYRVLWATIRFGEELRAYVDVGYSTIADACVGGGASSRVSSAGAGGWGATTRRRNFFAHMTLDNA
jgi:hypothetical protein